MLDFEKVQKDIDNLSHQYKELDKKVDASQSQVAFRKTRRLISLLVTGIIVVLIFTLSIHFYLWNTQNQPQQSDQAETIAISNAMNTFDKSLKVLQLLLVVAGAVGIFQILSITQKSNKVDDVVDQMKQDVKEETAKMKSNLEAIQKQTNDIKNSISEEVGVEMRKFDEAKNQFKSDYKNEMANYLKEGCERLLSRISSDDVEIIEEVQDSFELYETLKLGVSVSGKSILLKLRTLYEIIIALNYEQLITFEPRNYIKIGQAFLECGESNYLQASEVFSKYIDAFDNDPKSFDPKLAFVVAIRAGSSFYEIKEFSKAREIFKRAETWTQHYSAIENLDKAVLFYSIAMNFRKLNKFDKAYKYYLEAINLRSDYLQAYNNLGYMLMNDQKKYTEAKEAFEKALDINPKYDIALYNFACCYSLWFEKDKKSEYRENALDLLEKAISISSKNAIILKNNARTDKHLDAVSSLKRFKSATSFIY